MVLESAPRMTPPSYATAMMDVCQIRRRTVHQYIGSGQFDVSSNPNHSPSGTHALRSTHSQIHLALLEACHIEGVHDRCL